MSSETERQVERSGVWVSAAVSIVGALDVIVLVVLMRFWVTPAQFGMATLAVSLFPALDCLADMGLSTAVIGRGTDDVDALSSVTWLNRLAVLGLVILVVLASPLLGRFHHEPRVGQVLALYGGKLALHSLSIVPLAVLRRDLRYRSVALIRIIANVGDVGGKLAFAAAGFPVHCFVAGQICQALLEVIALQFLHPFRPRRVLRVRLALPYLRFGAITSVSQMLFELYSNIDYQVVGRWFGETALGYYRVAYDLVLYCVHFVTGIVADVALPAFARLRAEPVATARQFLRFSQRTLLMTLPFVALILLAAEDLLAVFFPAYGAAAAAARVLCVVGSVRAVTLLAQPLLYGVGRPIVYLRYTAVVTVVLTVAFVAAAHLLGPWLNYLSVAWAWAVVYPLVSLFLIGHVLTLIALPAWSYLRRMAVTVALAGAAFTPAMAARLLTSGWERLPRLAVISLLLALAGVALLRRGKLEASAVP